MEGGLDLGEDCRIDFWFRRQKTASRKQAKRQVLGIFTVVEG
jgi:hypothetical protein